MTFEVEAPNAPPVIETTEAATNYVEGLITRLEEVRGNCDVAVPGAAQLNALMQQRTFTAFLVRHGHALGVCDGFLRAQLLTPVAYNEFVLRVRATAAPTLVGSI